MKTQTFARVGAVLSFLLFFSPGAWLLQNAGSHETGEMIFGLVLMGCGCFAGSMVWLTGEKHCAK
ncbi:MAG TPA: hypothetical protein VGH90_11420 [Chthoniobacteraceae bacterium]|jgi:hypothetical protein